MKDFVPYQPSLELKELGFNEHCFGYYKINQYELHKEFHCYNSDYIEQLCMYISAPTFSQAFDWFEKHFGLYVEWLVDGWGEDECVSKENICYRIFIWEVGKPKPSPSDDLGAGSREQMNPLILKELIRITNMGPDWDSLNGFEMDELD